MSGEAIKATTSDSAGRAVVLTEQRWVRICAGHPELEQDLESLLRAVAAPTARLPGRDDAEEWLYLRGGSESVAEGCRPL